MKIRRSRQNWFVMLGVFVAVFLFAFLVQKFNANDDVDAANMAGFDAGYIISDYQMRNYTSMSEAQIQAFLKSKNPCNDTRTYLTGNNVGHLSESTPYSWHVAGGHYVCMADESFNGESAAHIIWQAAQDYKINPQVLIVLLEKEQSLVTDTLPNSVQYRSATGYGCPDTAACSSKYYGFRNQVRNAAAMFRDVLNGGWTNYPLGNNYIKYNPNAACGGSIVNVRNLATSALYRYTPYQPNAAALAGGNDGCGAYGNKNFYSYFEDWFGNIRWDGYPSLEKATSGLSKVAAEKSDLNLNYRTHVEHYGWLNWRANGQAAGTTGYSIRMEAFQLGLDRTTGIEYRSYIEGIGWESEYKKDGAISGTTGQSRRIEAIQVRFSERFAKNYDIYYRVHVQDIGWMDWVKNDAVAGAVGQSKQIEAIQVKVVKKDFGGPSYSAHVQNIGWMDWVKNGELAGTTGRALQIEGIKIKLAGELAKSDISYRAHVQNIGWMDWIKNGELAGTTGRALQIEALQIKLSDELADKYDIYYRVHVQNIGWMDWVKNGELAGTTGRALQIEAVEMKIYKK